MKNLYIDTRILDDLNRKSHFLSEEIMMENAAAALEKHIENYFTNSKIQKIPCSIILCLIILLSSMLFSTTIMSLMFYVYV